ncbi:hypothetical protein C8029_00745 [Roseobacter sp. TSBP12]|nr:hypothetical protein C8029_00745 [Roseobacter sp. TSBP12]
MNTLAITCIRDEGPWLLDWLAHHKAAGFTHFLIASHDCTDGSDQMLDALDAAGLITHVPFVPKGEKSVQWQAMKLLSKHKRYRSADLALFFDVDEYLVMQDARSVAELMPETADAMPLRWHLFGNNGFGTWMMCRCPSALPWLRPTASPCPWHIFLKRCTGPRPFVTWVCIARKIPRTKICQIGCPRVAPPCPRPLPWPKPGSTCSACRMKKSALGSIITPCGRSKNSCSNPRAACPIICKSRSARAIGPNGILTSPQTHASPPCGPWPMLCVPKWRRLSHCIRPVSPPIARGSKPCCRDAMWWN